jgi:hypothetical protein
MTERSRRNNKGPFDVSVPDVVLPEQFFPSDPLGVPDSPSKRLWFAVLLDAISLLRHRDRARATEAEHWIRNRQDDGVFSFANVCGVLGFEPRSLARGLLSTSSRLASRTPLRHSRTSRLRVTPRRPWQRQAAAVG